jgi:hypothetical protein
MRLEGLVELKNPTTSLGIEPATYRLLALCLNKLRYRAPVDFHSKEKKRTKTCD